MNIVTLDLETYFGSDYTLSKMTTEAYVRDPRFEALGCGIRWLDGQTYWCPGDKFAEHIGKVDWSDIAILCHHAHFDGLILSHHYGVKPHAWLDTLSMARLLLGNHLSVGLGALSAHYGLAAKTVPYELFKGRRWSELSLGVQQAVADGALRDVALTWEIFNKLIVDFPPEELAVVDATIRLFTEPTLVGDVEALGKVWTDEAQKKREIIASLGTDAASLQSPDKFAALLRAEGVEPEIKAGKNGSIFAFAKTDQFMKDLLEDENDRVRTLAEARLGVRSTIDQTRAERLGFMAGRGALPVYLGYAAAHTTRWGGGDKLNWQNFRRAGGIRRAIQAPDGHQIIKADKSQVECRFLNMVAEQWDVIQRFANKEDPYVGIASKAYGRPITRADETERGTGKQLELSCGYGAGAETIVRTAAKGTYGPPVRIELATGLQWRDLYRATHPEVVNLWRAAGRVISNLAGGRPSDWNVVRVETGRLILPNGCPMLYPDLNYFDDLETGEQYWRYRNRKGWAKLYGAKLVENLIQGLARIDMSQTLLRIRARLPEAKLVNLEHDAAYYVVSNKDVERAKEVVYEEFCRAPAWLPDIPLDCEVHVGERYG